ncbi:hypothetical protein DsansV1_C18g0149801 [Dioscorea sansibarensis]
MYSENDDTIYIKQTSHIPGKVAVGRLPTPIEILGIIASIPLAMEAGVEEATRLGVRAERNSGVPDPTSRGVVADWGRRSGVWKGVGEVGEMEGGRRTGREGEVEDEKDEEDGEEGGDGVGHLSPKVVDKGSWRPLDGRRKRLVVVFLFHRETTAF